MSNRIVIVIVAIIAMAAGFWVAQSRNHQVSNNMTIDFQGRIVSPARKVAIPELTGDNGSTFTQDDITGHWSLLFFGYTNCPDICPMTLNVLAQAKKIAPEDFPAVVFVSVDPHRDTINMLGEYVRYFDTEFRGVTGEAEMIQALSLQTSVVYMPVSASTGDDNYLVEHSSSILLFNPEGKLHAFLSAPHTPESILKALKAVNNSGSPYSVKT